MKKKFKVERLFFMLTAIVSIIGIILLFTSTEQCYSYEYQIYRNVKELQNVDDVRNELQDLKVEYTLKDNRLSLKEYDNIIFDVLDDKSCKIASNYVMQNFEKLDGDSVVNLTINGNLEDGKINETIKLVNEGNTFIKHNGEYYIKTPVNVGFLIVFAVIFVASIICTVIDVRNLIRKTHHKS